MVFSPLEKADSDATVDAGTANISRAIRASIGYEVEEVFQYCRMSKGASAGTVSPSKYLSSSLTLLLCFKFWC